MLGSCHDELIMFLVLHIKNFAQPGHTAVLNVSYFSPYGLQKKETLTWRHGSCPVMELKKNLKKSERSFHKAAIKGDDKPSSPCSIMPFLSQILSQSLWHHSTGQ